MLTWKDKGYTVADLKDSEIRAEVFADFQRDWDSHLCFGMPYKEAMEMIKREYKC